MAKSALHIVSACQQRAASYKTAQTLREYYPQLLGQETEAQKSNWYALLNAMGETVSNTFLP